MTPEQALWSEVLYAAVTDAVEGFATKSSQSAVARANDIKAARRYITMPNADFNQVCYMAGLDPVAVREHVSRKIANARTPAELANGKSQIETLTCNGQTRPINEWSDITGITRQTIRERIKRGWTIEAALTEPAGHRTKAEPKPEPKASHRPAQTITHNGKTHTIAQWASIIGVNPRTLHWRLRKGWSVEALLAPKLAKRGNLTTQLARYGITTDDEQTPGVHRDLQVIPKTGGMRSAQEIVNLNFSQDCAA
jgi:hypothetical protein